MSHLLHALRLGRYAHTRPDGDHDGLVARWWVLEPRCLVAVSELPRAGRLESEPRGHVAAPELSRAGRQESEPRGHVAAPELPPAERREPLS
jgi:hypothetical protein